MGCAGSHRPWNWNTGRRSPLIFNRFHRASNVRGRFAGTGIGLAGAQQIIALHGGDLKIESQEGAGTRVVVRLPLEEPA